MLRWNYVKLKIISIKLWYYYLLGIIFIIVIYCYNQLTTFVVTLLTHDLMLIVPDDLTFDLKYILKYVIDQFNLSEVKGLIN